MRKKRLLLSAILLLTTAHPVHADVLFMDSTFSGYSVPLIANPNGLTYSVNQLTAGGDPGNALQFLIDFPAPPPTFLIRLGAVNPAFTYDPSTQGAITSIDLAEDHYINVIDPSNFWNQLLSGTSFNWLLQQGSNSFFKSVPLAFVPGVFMPGSINGTVASDWFQINSVTGAVNTSSHPNFSASGSAIEFGVTGGASFTSSGPAGTIDIRFDNVSIDLHNTPEPSTLTLGLLGAMTLCGLGLSRRRRVSR